MACVAKFKHWRSGETLKAEDYGFRCFPIGNNKKNRQRKSPKTA